MTGAAGFIGRHVSEALARLDARVSLLDRGFDRDVLQRCEAEDAFRIVEMDVRSEDFSRHLIAEQYTAIVHLAGPASVPLSVEEPYRDFENSLLSTMVLLETLRTNCKQSRLLIASSAAVYGNPASLPVSEDAPAYPISPYGVAKLSAERYAAVYSRLYGLHIASLRFFSLYGPGQRKMLVYDLMSKLSKQPDRLTLLGTGRETRDFIYVEDAARAVCTVLTSGDMKGEVYNVAAGRAHSTLEAAQAVARAMKVDPEICFTGQGRAGDPDKWLADVKKIRRLGFEPQVDFNQGIQKTVDWYRGENR